MSTAKPAIQNLDGMHRPEMTRFDRSSMSLEQSALFATRLALARWTHGGDKPHLGQSTSNSAARRAIWYAQVQQNFQAWLEDGGFHRSDEVATVAAANPSGAPARDVAASPSSTCRD